MAQPADSSASLALAGTPRHQRRPWAVPVDYNDSRDSRVLRKKVNGQQTLATASAASRPVSAAEVAQARVFERLLQAECAELHELAHRLGTEDQQLDSNSSLSSEDLLQIRARIDEVDRLVRALQGRFPHRYPEANR